MIETPLYYFPSPLSNNFIEILKLLHPFGNISLIDKTVFSPEKEA